MIFLASISCCFDLPLCKTESFAFKSLADCLGDPSLNPEFEKRLASLECSHDLLAARLYLFKFEVSRDHPQGFLDIIGWMQKQPIGWVLKQLNARVDRYEFFGALADRRLRNSLFLTSEPMSFFSLLLAWKHYEHAAKMLSMIGFMANSQILLLPAERMSATSLVQDFNLWLRSQYRNNTAQSLSYTEIHQAITWTICVDPLFFQSEGPIWNPFAETFSDSGRIYVILFGSLGVAIQVLYIFSILRKISRLFKQAAAAAPQASKPSSPIKGSQPQLPSPVK